MVTSTSASPTPSPTSAPSKDAALDSQIGVTKLFVTSHTRCSTLGLYRYAGALLTMITSSASVPASSATASDQGVKLDIPATIVKRLEVQYAGSLLSACSMGTPMFKDINISPNSSVGMVQLRVDTNSNSTLEWFEVLPLRPCVLSVDRQCTEHILPKPPWSLVCSEIKLPCVSLLVAFSIGPELQRMHWPPSFKDNGKEMESELLPLFWLNFGFSQSALVLMSPRAISQSKSLQLQLYASCVLGYTASKRMVSFPHQVISWECMIYIVEPQTISCQVGLYFQKFELTPPWPPPAWMCSFRDKVTAGSATASQGSKMPKPPWLLCFGKMQAIGGFILEVPQWCRQYVVLVQWKTSQLSPMQLMAPTSANM